MRVDREVLEVLDQAETAGHFLMLAEHPKLERKLYERVAKVIELAGGKWDRRSAKHVFPDQAADALEPIFLTGEIVSKKAEFGFFETPAALVAEVIARAKINATHEVLEPSAGRGALARAALQLTTAVDAVEILPGNFDALLALDPRLRKVQMADFLELPVPPMGYDRVIMNPPFAKRADVRHILRAAKWVKPGGRLVSIASASVEFRSDGLGTDFRKWLALEGGRITRLPDGSFKESGTMINTVLIEVDL